MSKDTGGQAFSKDKKIVTIYQKPYTNEEPEGQAILVQKLHESKTKMEYWEVEFVTDGFKTQRWVKADVLIAERGKG